MSDFSLGLVIGLFVGANLGLIVFAMLGRGR